MQYIPCGCIAFQTFFSQCNVTLLESTENAEKVKLEDIGLIFL